jgi:hypothetical protein
MNKAQIEAEAKAFKAEFDAGECDWAGLDGTAYDLADHWLETQYSFETPPSWSDEEEDIESSKKLLKHSRRSGCPEPLQLITHGDRPKGLAPAGVQSHPQIW